VEELDWRDAYECRVETFGEKWAEKSLLEWAQGYRRYGQKVATRKRPAVVRIYRVPFPGERGPEEMEEWCRVKLLLHHSHSNPSELREKEERWEQAYDRCVEDHSEDAHHDTLPTKAHVKRKEKSEESDSDSDSEWAEGEDRHEVRSSYLVTSDSCLLWVTPRSMSSPFLQAQCSRC
jgi:hypothetical protein